MDTCYLYWCLSLSPEMIEDRLQQLDSEKWARYVKILDKIVPFLKWPPPTNQSIKARLPIPYYTDHGEGHSIRIISKLNKLIKESMLELTNYEIFFLLVSAWCHDLGMFLGRRVGEHPEDTRKVHHLRSGEVIEKFKDKLDLNKFELPIVRDICIAHREVSLNELTRKRWIGDDCVRLRLLAALLRIADACDLDYRRAPEAIFSYYRDFIPEISQIHWKKHFPISSVYYLREQSSVVLSVRFTTDLRIFVEQNKISHLVKNELQEELNSVREVFGYPSHSVGIFRVQIQDFESGDFIDETTYLREGLPILISIKPEVAKDDFLGKLSDLLLGHPGKSPVILEIRPPIGPLFMKLPVQYQVEDFLEFYSSIIDIFGDGLMDFHVEKKQVEKVVTVMPRRS